MKTLTLFFFVALTPILAQPPAGDWKPFSPKDGSFSILVPNAPKEHKKGVKTAAGETEVVLFELLVAPGDGKYAIGFTEYAESAIKPGTEDKRLDNARDAAKATAKGKLKREKSLLLDTFPGRELQIEIDD